MTDEVVDPPAVVVPPTAPRTIHEARLDAKYGRCFHEYCERLYDRADLTIGVLTLVNGSAAIATALGSYKDVSVTLAAVFGGLSIFGRLWGAGRKAERHGVAKRAYADLASDSHTKTLEQIDQVLEKLDGTAPPGFTGLRMPAYNANVRSNGYPAYAEPLSRWEKFLCALV